MILYIAGPMTDIPDKNIPQFNMVEAELRAVGYEVLNPARHEQDGRTWKDYMRLSLRDLSEAEGIATLEGWQDSKGASAEVSIAETILRIPVHDWKEWAW